jgi:hypothetical protein
MNSMPLLLLLCLSTSSCIGTAQASPEPLPPQQSLRVTSYNSRQVVVMNPAEHPQRPVSAHERPAHGEHPRKHKHDKADKPSRKDKHDRRDPGDTQLGQDKHDKADKGAKLERRRDIRARHARHSGKKDRTRRLQSMPQRPCPESTPAVGDARGERKARLKAELTKRRCEKRPAHGRKAPRTAH